MATIQDDGSLPKFSARRSHTSRAAITVFDGHSLLNFDSTIRAADWRREFPLPNRWKGERVDTLHLG
jgi:hypothetical protein